MESPVLWSHYGAKHTGICLGFDIDDAVVADVEYVGERSKVLIDDEGSVQFDEKFMSRLLRTKYEHWSYEEEVRAFVGLDQKTAERGIFFMEFSEKLQLRDVILGPLCEIPPKTVCALISSIYKGVTVTKAALAYKWYRVVPQQTFQCSS